MPNKKKILTVSYGTFSCKLEGFDDSVETMKRVAEYFRDLAATDRAFGNTALPLDTCHTDEIAKQEDGTAEVDGSQLILRAADRVEPAEDEDVMTSASVVIDPEPAALPTPSPDDTLSEDTAPKAMVDPEPSQITVGQSPQAQAFFADSAGPDEPETDFDADLETSVAFATFEPVQNAEDSLAEIDDEPESVTEKLERIRAIVSKHTASMPAPDTEGDAARLASLQASDDDTRQTAEASAENPLFEADSTPVAEPADDHIASIFKRLNQTDTEEEADQSATIPDQTDAANEEPGQFETSDDQQHEVEAFDSIFDAQTTTPEMPASFDTAQDIAEPQEEEDRASGDLPPTDEAPTQPALEGEPAKDVTRLMAEADHQMEEPESASSRSTFAHLRAAVSARFADQALQATPDTDETEDPYRDDLAEAVKPRRPLTSITRAERPAPSDKAPLTLEKEQRIYDDGDDTSTTTTIRPRRIAAAPNEGVDFDLEVGFASFAQQAEVKTLVETLEAAAAHIAMVEGHAEFSRPQLMTRARQADRIPFSREDGLRAFGQLLRSGKIVRIDSGRFEVTESIGFKPSEKIVG